MSTANKYFLASGGRIFFGKLEEASKEEKDGMQHNWI